MQLSLSVPSAAFGDAKVADLLAHWAPRLGGRGSDAGTRGLLREEGVCLDVADAQTGKELFRVAAAGKAKGRGQ